MKQKKKIYKRFYLRLNITMVLQKKDFIEFEFIGKIKDTGELFDSNIAGELKKINPEAIAKPYIIPLGEGLFMPAVEEFLIGKPETAASYDISLTPEKAFGLRNSKFVQIMPLKIFHSQRIVPTPGSVFNFDGRLGKVLSVNGGRVITDFNHPLAGKEVNYKINIIKKVEDLNQKTKALIEFFLQKDISFTIEGNKLKIEAETQIAKFLGLFKDKFKDLLNLELEIEESKKEEKKE
ncbi:Putative FKBP-type peptidyl-prolyl cis-trans isomerase [uncultured archaeon]|nr:Putative FKBP-type peptidyl-prolyl cis-trans isomerase [uncultured archaeon]